MNRACAAADIVVSERRLPRTCRPRWFKADQVLLADWLDNHAHDLPLGLLTTVIAMLEVALDGALLRFLLEASLTPPPFRHWHRP